MTSRPGPHRGLRFPPPPPGVPPPAVPTPGEPPAEFPVVRTRPRITYRPRSGTGPAWVALAVLAVVSGGLAYLVLRGDGGPWSRAVPGNAGGPAATRPRQFAPAPVEAATSPRAPTEGIAPAAGASAPAPPAEVPDPVAPSGRLDEAPRGRFERQIAVAHAAIRAGDESAVTAALDAAAAVAATDADAGERLARWRLLATYAAGFRTHREQALAAAGRGREYDLAGGVVAIIESDDDELVYRTAGRTERVSRDMIPEPLLLAIVGGWYAGAPQSGNPLFLGSYHATKSRPDLRAAKEHWSMAAAAGEPSARALLGILDDPVLRAGSAE